MLIICVPILIATLLLDPLNIRNIDYPLEFNGDNAYTMVEDQIELNLTHYRIPGTQGQEDSIEYFINKFKEINENFTYLLHNYTVLSVNCQNIVFKLNEHLNNIVILAAHYDSRAKATKDPNISLRSDPVPGANDGASGCAVLIELARVLYQVRSILDCQIWFLFFDAEDQGKDNDYGIVDWNWCEGSTRFANNLEKFHGFDESFDCLLLLDMVGGANLQFINEQHSTSSLLQEIFEVGRQLGFSEVFPKSPISNTILDDHVSFVEKGIPSADLIINFWNNPSWPYHHTTQDDLSHISNNSLEITGTTVEQFIYNNYLKIFSNNYVGNYPWIDDINVLDTDVLIIIITISSIIILIALSFGVYKKYFDKNITKVVED
ncbi:MAG: M28 family peptidase [Promethearchaeota archaeon]|nr:MAG: M28 family peptidase [Candidatus Lokiarchaeota archaeon]